MVIEFENEMNDFFLKVKPQCRQKGKAYIAPPAHFCCFIVILATADPGSFLILSPLRAFELFLIYVEKHILSNHCCD